MTQTLRTVLASVGVLVSFAGCAAESRLTSFVQNVVSFRAGEGAGFGAEKFPSVVYGGPRGGGIARGSIDVLTLGDRGEIVLDMGRDIVDGPGPDFVVYENAFQIAGGNLIFTEPGAVAVSLDGVTFTDFPCASEYPFAGCAGLAPVIADGDDPLRRDSCGPSSTLCEGGTIAGGGDAFDLHDVMLTRVRFVRIRDIGRGLVSPPTTGFDLDAVAIIEP